ncbi:MAG: hypothetical protein LBS26_02215 [Campylobacteraceae bacterium]|jgi:hypothetical protein|nr:hypothetical protein [Campylobacteraceae bacterium]
MRVISILALFFSLLAADEYKYLPDVYNGDMAIFKHFPAQVYKGKMAKIEKANANDVDVSINFAGKYYLNGFSCGKYFSYLNEERACFSLKLVDVTNSKEYRLDEQIIDYGDLAADYITFFAFRSYTLMIVEYFVKTDDKLIDYKIVYYDFKNGKFNELKRAYVMNKDMVEFLDHAAKCEHFDGGSIDFNLLGEEEKEIYEKQIAQNNKDCGEAQKTIGTLRKKYKNNKDILAIIKKYEYLFGI